MCVKCRHFSHSACPAAKGTFADNSTRKCVIYCPLGSFADPTTQICVAGISSIMQNALKCPIIMEATSLATAYWNATGDNLLMQSAGNAPGSVQLAVTEITQLAAAWVCVLRARELSQTLSLIFALPFAQQTTTVIKTLDLVLLASPARIIPLEIQSRNSAWNLLVHLIRYRVLAWIICRHCTGNVRAQMLCLLGQSFKWILR